MKKRKKDNHNCRKAKCQICHGDKYPKRELTKKEKENKKKFKEGLEEI